MSVEVTGLTKIYGQQKAVNNVSFNVAKGEVLGFLGPNGAGKSTTMKIITCFLPQTDGTVKVCGFDTIKQSMEVRRRVGYLPENTPLYYNMYILEYLRFIARVHKLGKNTDSRIEEVIELIGLGRERRKQIGQLSKGYKQRVGLAQAMLHNPDVLILDEPTAGLDPNQLVDIRRLIRDIGKEKTVILSTHIMQEVQAMCDRVIIINKGELVADDTPDTLQKRVSGLNSVKVEFKEAVTEKQLRQIAGVTDVQQGPNGEWNLFSDKKADIREQVFEFAKNNNLVLLNMQLDEGSLEDVFHKLTK